MKTASSGATMPIPAPLVVVLTEHRAQQLKTRLASPVWREPDRVFTTSHGTPLEPRNINHEWAKVCASAGITPDSPA